MNKGWWDGDRSDPQWYEHLSEKQKDRLCEVQDFMGNNCLGWFKGSKQVSRALTEVLCRLPDEAADFILCNSDIVVIDGSSSAAWSRRLDCPAYNEPHERRVHIVVLRKRLRDMPYKAVVGEVAHELAHVFAGHDVKSDESCQEEADRLARDWGFGDEIDALKREPVEN
jgi:hypothetical protein